MSGRTRAEDLNPKVGDMIEIFRGAYQHWVVYIGDGNVIHLTPPTEQANAGSSSKKSMLCNKAIVKKENLLTVAGTDLCRINNWLDGKHTPRPGNVIQLEAESFLNQELPYSVFEGNCEHFATELRYSRAESGQVRRAAEVGIGLSLLGIVLFGAATVKVKGKEKQPKGE